MIQQKFRKRGEQAIASYDSFEITTARGIVEMFGGDTLSGTSLTLSTSQFYGHPGYTVADNALLDADFDIKILKPCILEGGCVFNLPRIYSNNAGTAQDFTIYWSGALLKVNNNQETVLGSQVLLNQVSQIANGSANFEILTINTNISRTVLKGGDTLRFNIQASPSGGTNRKVWLYNDPKNRTFSVAGTSTTSSQLSIKVPFVPDI